MIRTLTSALCYDRTNSRAIGYYATQQNAAYNHGVDVLNREPELPKRSGRNHPDAINKRITAWRQDNQKGADDPYHIHREGGKITLTARKRNSTKTPHFRSRAGRMMSNDLRSQMADMP